MQTPILSKPLVFLLTILLLTGSAAIAEHEGLFEEQRQQIIDYSLPLAKKIKSIMIAIKQKQEDGVQTLLAVFQNKNNDLEDKTTITDLPMGTETQRYIKEPELELKDLKQFSYKDLKPHWLYSTVVKLNYLGYLRNKSSFNPKELITKEQLAHYLSTFYKLKEKNYNPRITDLNRKAPYNRDIQICVSNKIFTLDNKGKFNPEAPVSKAQALVAIGKALGWDKNTGSSIMTEFEDLKANHWAYNSVRAAIKNDMIIPYPFFKPKAPVTKQALIAILAKSPDIREEIDSIKLVLD